MSKLELSVDIGCDDIEMYTFPAKYEVCHRCSGHGKHVNPNIECDGGGITGSEMREILQEDPDFLDDYFGGMYDISCSCCDGERVVLVIDESCFDKEDKDAYEKYLVKKEQDRYYDSMCASERRCGA